MWQRFMYQLLQISSVLPSLSLQPALMTVQSEMHKVDPGAHTFILYYRLFVRVYVI